LSFSNLTKIRTGIGLRLGIGFAVVGLLAASANLVAERGASLVRDAWTITEPRPQAAYVQPVTLYPGKARIQTRSQAQTHTQTQERDQALPSRDALVAAHEKYRRAIAARVTDQPGSEADLSSARESLRGAVDRFATLARGKASATLIAAMIADEVTLERNGLHAVALSEERRLRADEFRLLLDSIKSRIDNNLSRSVRLFGRVIARQYLVQLRDDVAALQSAGAAVQSNSYSQARIASIRSAQSVVGNAIRTHIDPLTRSESKAWVESLQADIGRSADLVGVIVLLDQDLESSIAALNGTSKLLSLRFAQWDKERARSAAAPAAIAKLAIPMAKPTLVSNAPAVEVRQRQVAAAEAQTRDLRQLIGLFTATLLGVSLLICIGTVRSIVKPVKSLLEASSRIAAGERNVVVERGGVRELDTLAAAFNEMAVEVATARQASDQYKQELERRVEERTQQLKHQATHDPLTGLPNRRQLFDVLARLIDKARGHDLVIAVYFLDLDNFKHINDGTGHEFGDQLLIACAERLRQLVGKHGFAARFGGDEFTLITSNPKDSRSVRTFGEKLVQAFARPLEVQGREILVGISVGAALFPDHHDDPESLLRAADTALYQAKIQGRNRFSLYSPELLAAAAERFSTEQQLRRALEAGELELVYQPEVRSVGFEVSHVEALLRWNRPDGTVALPGAFLSVAEESGLIMEISNWALRAAISAVARWRACDWPTARVAVNVSSRQLIDQRFAGRLATLLNEFRVPSEALEIELTETVLQTGHAIVATLTRLRQMGIAIALDDFGTGYSSLASLDQLPITRVKLDRSLIADMDSSPRSQAIVNATLQLCADLGLDITAEGIERPKQFMMLLSQRQMLMQGFLIGSAVPEADVAALVVRMPATMEALLLESGSRAETTSVVSLFPSPRERSK
jgi:diguanylate cyclase (GGDEF)-like protein